MTTEELAQAISSRLPRKPNENKVAWARRIHDTDAQVKGMEYEQRINVLAAVTQARRSNLRMEPALKELPPDMVQLVQAISSRLPRKPNENKVAWARRIHDTDAQVKGMEYERRINVLAAVTQATPGNLRMETALKELQPDMAQLAQAIAQRLPRKPNEKNAAWARRIHDTDAQVKKMGYEQRINVLAAVTQARPGDLRKETALKELPPDLVQLAQAITWRLPRKFNENKVAWARRIHDTDAQVKGMEYERRINVLAAVTQATPGNLRMETALKELQPDMAQLAQAIAQRLPRKPNEKNAAWARRIHDTDAQVKKMNYEQRIDVLAAVTRATPGQLRLETVLKELPPDVEQLAQAIVQRLPRKPNENKVAWARRIHDTDAQVKKMDYEQRIDVLAAVADARSDHLRKALNLR